jgi:hypothetical protein
MPAGTIDDMNRVDDLSRKRAALLLVGAVFLAAAMVVTWPMRFGLPGVAAPAPTLPPPLVLSTPDLAPVVAVAVPGPGSEAAPKVLLAASVLPYAPALALQPPPRIDGSAEAVPELPASHVLMAGVLAPMAVPEALSATDAALPAHGAVTRALATAGRQIGVAARVTGGAIRAAF